jgi:hypothetical protein
VSVDYGGLVNNQRINEEDIKTLKRWDEQGFIFYSRLTWDSVQLLYDKNNTDIVYLSEEAWKLAHEERRERSMRMRSKKPICDLVTTKKNLSSWKRKSCKQKVGKNDNQGYRQSL